MPRVSIAIRKNHTAHAECRRTDIDTSVIGNVKAPEARINAERLLTSGEGFASIADAAVVGAGSHAFTGSHTAVLFFMLAQAAEIAMKAWLVMDGVPLSDLSKRELPNGNLVVSSKHPFGAINTTTSVREYTRGDGRCCECSRPRNQANFAILAAYDLVLTGTSLARAR